MTELYISIFGAIFAFFITYARLNKFNTITGLAMLEDFTVAKTMALAIGIGAILISVLVGLGFASWHIKPFLVFGLIFGGILFGSGMAILGYCPGTLAISVGEGSLDALIGLIGGLFGGWIYGYFYPDILNLSGPDLGQIALSTMLEPGFLFYTITIVFGLGMIFISFLLPAFNPKKNWMVSGLGLAILSAVLFLHATMDKPIGASTAFPYLADVLTGYVNNLYFEKIKSSGSYQIYFLGGAMLYAFIQSIFNKTFKVKLIYQNWMLRRGHDALSRVFWAFFGGFILIFGARLAGGCTSGHILSGGMQIAFTSLFFTLIAFTALIITGKIFYKK